MMHISGRRKLLSISWVLMIALDVVLSIPVDNGLVAKMVGSGRTEIKCQGHDVDLMFVVDGSSSIKAENFVLVKNFIASLVEKSVPSDDNSDTHVGIVQFSGTVRTEFALDTHAERAKLLTSIRKLPYLQGTTKLGLALEHTRDKELIESRGDRPDIPNLIIVITDGRSQDEPGPAASTLRDAGNKMIVVGVTDNIDRDQLLSVAGAPEAIFEVSDFKDLNEKLTDAIAGSQLCLEVEIPGGEAPVNIVCNPESMIIEGETRNPFEGEVYVKGQSGNPECSALGDGGTVANLEISHDSCGTVRRRSLNPPGVFFENTVSYKFHPRFVTKVDMTMKVSCFFMEAEKTVKTNIGVSMLTTETQTAIFPMPTCQYRIHKDSPTGPLVQYAILGEPLFHVWECNSDEPTDLFSMRVYDCKIADGQGQNVQILDDNGCSIDKNIMTNLEYAESPQMLASVETHAFKFADISQQFYQCQIAICVNLEGGCNDTRPSCEGTGEGRILGDVTAVAAPIEGNELRRRNKRSSGLLGTEYDEDMVLDVDTEWLRVLDAAEGEGYDSLAHQLDPYFHGGSSSVKINRSSDFCVSQAAFFMIIAAGILTMVTACAAVVVVFKVRHSRSSLPSWVQPKSSNVSTSALCDEFYDSKRTDGLSQVCTIDQKYEVPNGMSY